MIENPKNLNKGKQPASETLGFLGDYWLFNPLKNQGITRQKVAAAAAFQAITIPLVSLSAPLQKIEESPITQGIEMIVEQNTGVRIPVAYAAAAIPVTAMIIGAGALDMAKQKSEIKKAAKKAYSHKEFLQAAIQTRPEVKNALKALSDVMYGRVEGVVFQEALSAVINELGIYGGGKISKTLNNFTVFLCEELFGRLDDQGRINNGIVLRHEDLVFVNNLLKGATVQPEK